MENQFKDILKKLIKTLDMEVKKITTYISNKEKKSYNSSIFEIKKVDSSNCGIYFFIMKEDVFVSNIDNFNSVSYSSKLKKKESNKITLKKDDVLYLGKSENIQKRIKEHEEDVEDNSTYSLKLNSENRKFIKEKYKKVYFELNNDYKKFSYIILPYIESKLHNNLKPCIGKK